MELVKIVSPIHFNVLGDTSKRYEQTIYLVDIEKERCTCNDWRMQTARLLPSEQKVKPTYTCKHLKFIHDLLTPKYENQ